MTWEAGGLLPTYAWQTPMAIRWLDSILGYDSTNLIIYSPDKLVATIGVHDLIIVRTDDVLLICHKDHDQDVRELVKMLQERRQTEYL